ncbi:MAG: peptidoglycan editing factor PgeF [Helicobacteraceae bacterium]|jgi:YfiH family protein|nr:peptidoglycan editing factor PgeF [Helicobacteraceae bacterium]
MLRFTNLSKAPFVKHIVTTRQGGVSLPPFDSLNLGLRVGDDPAKVAQNRAFTAQALKTNAIVYMNQVHSDRVVLIDYAPLEPPECDAMISKTPNIALAVLTADCVPILFYDPKVRAIGVAHAGWKGSVALIAIKTVEAMRENFGSNPSDILAAIAPAICAKRYEVGDAVIDEWRKLPDDFQPALSDRRLDLQLANRLQLRSIGVLDRNIETMALCTYENDDFFSYRRANPTGRFASIIAIAARAFRDRRRYQKRQDRPKQF